MSALAVPATMDEITPEWLTGALRSAGCLTSCSVTAIDKVTIGQGVGILGELARITPTYTASEPNAPKTLIAKIPTADEGGKGIANMLGFYEKEVRFYGELCHSIGVRSARGYYAAGDPASVRYVILMEDLGDLRLGDQVAGASAEECETLIREVARLHARWWDSPELDRIDWIPAVNSPQIKMSSLAMAAAMEPFLTNFSSHIKPHHAELAQKLLFRVNPMQDGFADRPVTLCHGDLRLDNVFWGSPDGSSPVTLIDWQIALKARGPYDIAYFMSQSVEPAVRARNEERLVRVYHGTLVAGGVKGYSFDDCWRDYRAATMSCLIYPVVALGSVDLANERGLALALAMLQRSLSAIDDLNAGDILDEFEPAPLPAVPGA